MFGQISIWYLTPLTFLFRIQSEIEKFCMPHTICSLDGMPRWQGKISGSGSKMTTLSRVFFPAISILLSLLNKFAENFASGLCWTNKKEERKPHSTTKLCKSFNWKVVQLNFWNVFANESQSFCCYLNMPSLLFAKMFYFIFKKKYIHSKPNPENQFLWPINIDSSEKQWEQKKTFGIWFWWIFWHSITNSTDWMSELFFCLFRCNAFSMWVDLLWDVVLCSYVCFQLWVFHFVSVLLQLRLMTSTLFANCQPFFVRCSFQLFFLRL